LIEVLIGPGDGREDDVPARLIRRFDGPEGLVDQGLVGIRALAELRQRPRGTRGAGLRGPCGRPVLVVVASAARHQHQRQRGDERCDPDPVHVPPP
jgi:hypothetical protein